MGLQYFDSSEALIKLDIPATFSGMTGGPCLQYYSKLYVDLAQPRIIQTQLRMRRPSFTFDCVLQDSGGSACVANS